MERSRLPTYGTMADDETESVDSSSPTESVDSSSPTESVDSSSPEETVQSRHTKTTTATKKIQKEVVVNPLVDSESKAGSTSKYGDDDGVQLFTDTNDIAASPGAVALKPLMPIIAYKLQLLKQESLTARAIEVSSLVREQHSLKSGEHKTWITGISKALDIPTPTTFASFDDATYQDYAKKLAGFIKSQPFIAEEIAPDSGAQRMAELNHTLEGMSVNGSEESTDIPKQKKPLWNKDGKKSGANASSAMRGTKSLTDDEWLKITTDITQHLTPKGYTTNMENSNVINFSKEIPPPQILSIQRDKGKLRMLSDLPPIELAAAWVITGQSPLTISEATPENAKLILKAFDENHPKFRVIISDKVLQSMDAQGLAAYEAHKTKWPAAKSSPGPAQSKSPSKAPESSPTSTDPKPAASPPPLASSSTDTPHRRKSQP